MSDLRSSESQETNFWFYYATEILKTLERTQDADLKAPAKVVELARIFEEKVKRSMQGRSPSHRKRSLKAQAVRLRGMTAKQKESKRFGDCLANALGAL